MRNPFRKKFANDKSSAPATLDDDAILATIVKKTGKSQKKVERDENSRITLLDYSECDLTKLPAEIGQLTNLQDLDLSGNLLTELPVEIWRLTNLQALNLQRNNLRQLSAEIGHLSNLQKLVIWGNELSQLPAEIGQLTNLQYLDLANHSRIKLPPEIKQLTLLQRLSFRNNRLSRLPPELWQLTALQWLDLAGNELSQLPVEIGQLANLQDLDLARNQLTEIPAEIGRLTNLQKLDLSNNPDLQSPPPEVVNQGTEAILAYMRALLQDNRPRYEAKLLLVGEGGTGKSSLLAALRGEGFDPHRSTTHGIEVARLLMPHPELAGKEITLNTWDFGGQEIYHATHQFFLTKRSLYLVLWNARLGAEQGRLTYWLNTIQALAPEAPILLVATHIDERAPDLNFAALKEAYPQVTGQHSVSNKHAIGIDELKEILRRQAAALPLMGQPWPGVWLAAEQAVLALSEHHIDADTYAQCCKTEGVEADLAKGEFGQLLNDLGKILYFQDDDVLSNLVVLKPNWITKAISRVLTDEPTKSASGVLSHADLPRIWATDDDGVRYDRRLYPIFLRMMERFDLSYQIEADIPGDHPTRSLVPQLLPHEPPADLPTAPATPDPGHLRVEMIYRLNFVPAGIMPWFIVRTHRYTRSLHWRDGAILEYEGHLARVELNASLREIRLTVWGPEPHNFFTLLKNTQDEILGRFEGLRIQRDVPCICHWQSPDSPPCPRYYRYEDLVKRMEAGRTEVECPDTFRLVSVPTLLYGIHISTDRQVMSNIAEGQRRIETKLETGMDLLLQKMSQQSELIARNFTRQWNLEMAKLEAECPGAFYLTPASKGMFNPKDWVSEPYNLHLLCQHPPGPHACGQMYPLRQSAEWWVAISPWLKRMIDFLKFAVPMGKAIAGVYDPKAAEQLKSQIDLMEEITKNIPNLPDVNTLKGVAEPSFSDQRAEGPALRALYNFLKQADPSGNWGGLYRTPTPDGNILWLCNEHRQPYLPKPLALTE